MRIKLRKIVKDRGYRSLYNFADHIGVSRPSVYAWEKGKRSPNSKHIDIMCHVLNCSIADIIEAEEPNKADLEDIELYKKNLGGMYAS